MTGLTDQQIRLGITPRSDQVNADDLMQGPLTVTIEGASAGDEKHPWFVHLAEFPKRPFKPCVTMRRLLLEVLGTPNGWAGERMTIYRDPQVKFKGETVGGVRISHFGKLSEPKAVLLTKNRTQKIEWVVGPITEDQVATLSPDDQKYVAESTVTLKTAVSLEELEGHKPILKRKSQAIRDALRPIYNKRKVELLQMDTNATE